MDGSPSSIVMLGFGNGTFAGSPSLVLSLGFGIGDAGVVVSGPFRVVASQAHSPGSAFGLAHVPGSIASFAHRPGSTAGQGV